MADVGHGTGPPTRPLGRGTRVRHATQPELVGTIVGSRARRKRWTYQVRWDGNDHDSGEYGIRSLVKVYP